VLDISGIFRSNGETGSLAFSPLLSRGTEGSNPAPSSGESGDRTFGSGRWTVTTVQHQRFANRKPSGESDEQSAEQLQEVSIAKRG